MLALAIIITYKIINEIGYFAGIFKSAWSIATPFLYGFVLAYIINIPRGAIQKLFGKSKFKFFNKKQKAFSLIIVFILAALVIFLVSYMVIPSIYKSISYFISNLSNYYAQAREYINYLNTFEILGFDVNISIDGIMTVLQDTLKNISVDGLSSPFGALSGVSSAIFGVSSAIFSGFLTIVSAIYFVLEMDKLKIFAVRLIKVFTAPDTYGALVKYGKILDNNFRQYIKTQTVDGCILGSIATIELLFIGSPYFLVLGVMLGIINYIPYFGSIIGSLAAVVVVAFTQGLTRAAITAAVLLVTQQIDGNVIQPKLMGGSFSLSPILVIVSITAGGALAGVMGMIVAIPVVSILKDIAGEIVSHYESRKSKGPDGPPPI